FSFSLAGAMPFLDVEHHATWNVLEEALEPRLSGDLDVGAIRGPDRLLTRTIAQWAYAQVDEDGNGRFAGIRYMSRLGDFECWAIFDGTPVQEAAPPRTIERDDPVLRKVANAFELTIH